MMGDGSSMFFGSGLMLIFWVIVIVLIVVVIKAAMGSNASKTGKQNDSPIEILKKRYARGEISEDEYHRQRQEFED